MKELGTGTVRETMSDLTGHYEFSAVPVGEYEIRVSQAQFTGGVRTGVHLVVGQSATIDRLIGSTSGRKMNRTRPVTAPLKFPAPRR